MSKISIIGAGNIGSTIAHIASRNGVRDIVLFDIIDGMPQGKALDLMQSLAVTGKFSTIVGSNDYMAIENSDVIIVTAGMPRKPGMDRKDLIKINADIIKTITGPIVKYSPNAFVIVATNPLDAMVWLMYKLLNMPSNKIVGMAGTLDVARFKYFLSLKLNIAAKDINAIVIGSHNDLMLPLVKYVTVGGVKLMDLVNMNLITLGDIDEIVQKTQHGGAEIVKLLKNGSAYYSPAESIFELASAYLYDQKRMLKVTALMQGEYGLNDICVGVPAIIDGRGLRKIIELELDKSEKDLFDRSVSSIREMLSLLNE